MASVADALPGSAPLHLRRLFADDPQRGKRFAIDACGIYLDYSKNRITAETIQLLIQLAEACGLRERLEAMFSGQKINVTEQPRGTSHGPARAYWRANFSRRYRRRAGSPSGA